MASALAYAEDPAPAETTPPAEEEDMGKTPGGFEKGQKKGWGDEKVPPGWSKGEKTGWQGGDRPPGLAKKAGGSSSAKADKVKKAKKTKKAKGSGKKDK